MKVKKVKKVKIIDKTLDKTIIFSIFTIDKPIFNYYITIIDKTTTTTYKELEMFSNFQFEYGTVREFVEILYAKTDKIINTDTSIGTIDFGGKNNIIRFENLKKLVTDFLVRQNIKFTVNPARIIIRSGSHPWKTVIWNFKLNSVDCFALIAVNATGGVEGLIYGETASTFFSRFAGVQRYRNWFGGAGHSTRRRTDENATISKNYNEEILINDFYYFLKHFGEFKESYENFKNKKKLKIAVSKQSSIALLSRLVKNHFDISVKIEDGFIKTQRHDVQYGENKLTVAFEGSERGSFIQLQIRMNNQTICAGRFYFSTENGIMESTTKIKNLAAFLNIVRGA